RAKKRGHAVTARPRAGVHELLRHARVPSPTKLLAELGARRLPVRGIATLDAHLGAARAKIGFGHHVWTEVVQVGTLAGQQARPTRHRHADGVERPVLFRLRHVLALQYRPTPWTQPAHG